MNNFDLTMNPSELKDSCVNIITLISYFLFPYTINESSLGDTLKLIKLWARKSDSFTCTNYIPRAQLLNAIHIPIITGDYPNHAFEIYTQMRKCNEKLGEGWKFWHILLFNNIKMAFIMKCINYGMKYIMKLISNCGINLKHWIMQFAWCGYFHHDNHDNTLNFGMIR